MYLNDTWLTSKSKMKANRKMGLNLRTVEVDFQSLGTHESDLKEQRSLL